MSDFSQPQRPRVRFGTISWGLIVGLGGSALLVLLLTPGARSELVQWVLTVHPHVVVLLALVAIGALLLLLGVLAVIRGQQLRSRSTARSTTGLPPADPQTLQGWTAETERSPDS